MSTMLAQQPNDQMAYNEIPAPPLNESNGQLKQNGIL